MKNQIPIWVINLERCRERRDFMETQLSDLDLDYEIIKAVDGERLTPENKALHSEKNALKHTGRPLSNGEIALCLSHYKLYERMLKSEVPSAMILEDDVIIGSHFVEFFQHIHKLPKNLDILYLHPFYNLWDIQLGKLNTRKLFDIYSTSLYMHDQAEHFHTDAYYIALQGAKKLFDQAFPLSKPHDHFMKKLPKKELTAYRFIPPVVTINQKISSMLEEERMRLRDEASVIISAPMPLIVKMLYWVAKKTAPIVRLLLGNRIESKLREKTKSMFSKRGQVL